jgi:prepilin-type N-terminal cleavage/methylation domain-containing protein
MVNPQDWKVLMKKKAFRNGKGFTLIELMIVICILSILLGAFSSAMIRWLPNYRFNSYVRNLQSAVQFARLSAVKGKADVFLQFDKANREYRAFLDDTSDMVNRGKLDAGDTSLGTLDMPKGAEFVVLFGTSDSLVESVFDSRGVSNLSGDICMKSSSEMYKGVRMTLAGNSRIIRSGDGGATWQ